MTITNYKPINKNTLVAAFDLELQSGLVIRGALQMKNEKGSWIAFPGIPYEAKGKKSYKPVLEIPERATRDKFNDLVLDAIEAQA